MARTGRVRKGRTRPDKVGDVNPCRATILDDPKFIFIFGILMNIIAWQLFGGIALEEQLGAVAVAIVNAVFSHPMFETRFDDDYNIGFFVRSRVRNLYARRMVLCRSRGCSRTGSYSRPSSSTP